MFSKEIAIAFPLLLAAAEFSFFNGRARRRWILIAPFLVLLCVIPVTAVAKRALTAAALTGVESGPGSGAGFISQHDYFLTQCRALPDYVRLLVLPVNQNIDYDYPPARSPLEPGVIAGAALFLAWIFAASIAFQRNRLISYGMFWFICTLLPQASIVPKPDLFIEHRLYLPSIGFIMATVSLVFSARRTGHDRAWPSTDKIIAVLMLAAAVVLAVGTFRRNGVWKDRVTLWDDAVRKSPGKARPYLNRGLAYADRRDYAAAIADYSAALRLNPDYARAYCNRGVVYADLKNYPRAIADHSAALRLRPDYFEAYCNRGVAYAMMKDYQPAFRNFDAALKLNPGYAPAYNNRGVTAASAGAMAQAADDFTRAIRLNPRYAEAYKNRGAAFLLLNNYPAAAADFAAALRLAPQNAPELKPLLEFARQKER